MRVTLNGTVFNGEYGWSMYKNTGATTNVSGLGAQIAGGGFSHSFGSTITTGTVLVPVNTPFTIRLDSPQRLVQAELETALPSAA